MNCFKKLITIPFAMLKNFNIVNDLIDKSKKIVLTTHLIPDGDAIGSVLAMLITHQLLITTPFLIHKSKLEFLGIMKKKISL